MANLNVSPPLPIKEEVDFHEVVLNLAPVSSLDPHRTPPHGPDRHVSPDTLDRPELGLGLYRKEAPTVPVVGEPGLHIAGSGSDSDTIPESSRHPDLFSDSPWFDVDELLDMDYFPRLDAINLKELLDMEYSLWEELVVDERARAVIPESQAQRNIDDFEYFKWEEIEMRLRGRNVMREVAIEQGGNFDFTDPRAARGEEEEEIEEDDDEEELFDYMDSSAEEDDEEEEEEEFDFTDPPAARAAVESIPSVPVEEADGYMCAVCKEGMEGTARRLPCSHRYHGECILPWLAVRNTCPVCRFELPTDDPEYESRRVISEHIP